MNLPQTGGCQCGAIRFEITQAPQMVYTCHCADCQRMTSSAFSMACVLPEGAFRVVRGEPKAVHRLADSGSETIWWICPECGSWVCASRPGAMVRNVRGGALDDTSWLCPTVHFWTRNKQPWIAIPEGDQIFETQPADLVRFFFRPGERRPLLNPAEAVEAASGLFGVPDLWQALTAVAKKNYLGNGGCCLGGPVRPKLTC